MSPPAAFFSIHSQKEPNLRSKLARLIRFHTFAAHVIQQKYRPTVTAAVSCPCDCERQHASHIPSELLSLRPFCQQFQLHIRQTVVLRLLWVKLLFLVFQHGFLWLTVCSSFRAEPRYHLSPLILTCHLMLTLSGRHGVFQHLETSQPLFLLWCSMSHTLHVFSSLKYPQIYTHTHVSIIAILLAELRSGDHKTWHINTVWVAKESPHRTGGCHLGVCLLPTTGFAQLVPTARKECFNSD